MEHVHKSISRTRYNAKLVKDSNAIDQGVKAVVVQPVYAFLRKSCVCKCVHTAIKKANLLVVCIL